MNFLSLLYMRGCYSMSTTKIYAKDFLRKLDFYHLAKQFYRYTYRYPELEKIKNGKK